MRRRSTFIPLAAALLCLPALPAAGGAGGKVAVGFIRREAAQHRAEWRDYGYRRALVAAGMDGSLIERRGMLSGTLDAEEFYRRLAPFHAVVLATTEEGVHELARVRANCQAARRAIERYVRAGGGLFVLLQAHRYPGSDDEAYFNELLAGLGVRFLHEGVHDPNRTFRAPKTLALPSWEYFFTSGVRPHATTEGVRRLYLPKMLFTRPGVAAFALGEGWTTVVAGERSARSFAQNATDNHPDWTKAGTYPSSPPIATARAFGKGRVFVLAAPHMHVFGNYGKPNWPHVFERAGDAENGRASDGHRLVTNALRWLGEPALKVPELGTYRDVAPKPITFPASVNWDKHRFAPALPGGGNAERYADGRPISLPPAARGVRGVIGAHSAYTDGEGTVAQYVAAAKQAGLGFLVFTDPLAQLTPAEFARLWADCAAASKDPAFCAAAGIEYTDAAGNRWAAWGQKLVYPPAEFEYRGRRFRLWDGRRVHLTGHYEILCGFRPNGLIDYRTLAKGPCHAANMWWFFRVFPWVYEGERQVADNVGAYLSALRDLRRVDVASLTRLRRPAEVAAATARCVTVLPDLAYAREWLDARCSSWTHPKRPYVTQGPLILQWQALNTQRELPVDRTRGCQRVRLRFEVASDAGLAEVRVHDASFGLARRFDAAGARHLARAFEMVHDRQHFLVLEVVDRAGRRAVSKDLLLYCYKSGLYRCGDNLNTLSSSSMTWHPDRAEMPLAKHHEDIGRLSIAGFDTSSGVASQPVLWRHDFVRLAGYKHPHYPMREQGAVNKILNVTLTSSDVQIFGFRMDHLIEGWDNARRPGPAYCCIPRKLGELEFFEREHTCTGLRSRVDYFVKWNHRREFEGTKDYRGGVIWHEGRIRFRKDATLRGTVPIPLVDMDGPGGAAYRQFDHLFVTDRDRGTLGVGLRPEDKVYRLSGRLARGGYIAAMPTDVGYFAFLADSKSDFAYDAQEWDKTVAKFGRIFIGLGHDGQKVRAGEVLSYRFGVATLNDRRVSNALLEDLRRAWNLDGRRGGYPVTVRCGRLVDAEFFLTLQADGREVAVDLGPREMICDLAIRVRGLADNGCAAVFSSRNPFFRFIAVAGETAYLQEPTEKRAALWIGNVFTAADPRVKLTLVQLGQAPGKAPFLEVHNPAAEAIRTVISSPPHTPLFGGFRREVAVPAGSSIRLTGLKPAAR